MKNSHNDEQELGRIISENLEVRRLEMMKMRQQAANVVYKMHQAEQLAYDRIVDMRFRG